MQLKRPIFNRWFSVLLALIFTLGLLNSPHAVQAEGSNELNASGLGKRALTEWRTNTTAGLYRRTFFRVYAREGEYILMGSSAMGLNQGDIVLYQETLVANSQINAAALAAITPTFRCSTNGGGLGVLRGANGAATRAMEIQGATRNNGVDGGYNPCVYTVPAGGTGTYWVAMYGPDGPNGNADGAAGTIAAPVITGAVAGGQRSGVSVWDITVRATDPASGANRPGRVFVDYLAQISGGNGPTFQMYSTFYAVTPDGYVYRVELNGLDPNGYIFYGNRVGFLDPDGITPLYHDVTYPDNTLSAPAGGVILPPAEAKIFFNDPRGGDLPVSILPSPAVPSIANVSYEGTAGGATGYRSLGGTFTYSGNVGGISEIIIQGAGSSDFEPDNPLNRRILSSSVTGSNSVTWDGRDNSGNFFPVGANYPFRVIFHAGEYHFPLLDAENSPNGGPTLTLLNPINGVCPFNPAYNCRTAFYDDRGYRLSTGTVVGTVGVTLPGDANAQNPPAVNRSDQNDGFDTSTNQRAWGNGAGTGFGNWKALDLWSYYPVAPISEVLNVIDPPTQDLRIIKTHTGLFNLGPAGGVFSITVSNVGTAVLNGAITVTDFLPAGLTPVSATTPSGWNACSIVGQTVTCVHPNAAGLAAGAALPVITLTVDVAASAAPSVTNTASVANANNSNPSNNQSDDIVTVNAPELSVTKSDSVSGSLPLGSSFNWTLTAANTGTGAAIFASGQVILRDPLPANASYAAPIVGGIVNVANPAAISCAVDVSSVLTCTASGAAVTLGAVNGSFIVTIPVNPTAAGSLANTATVDPNNVVIESNEGNNTGSDTVAVVSIDAVDDIGIRVNGTSGGQSLVNVLVNDLLNGAPALLANVVLTQVSTTNPGVTLNPADSSVNVAPGTPFGNYTVTYQICDALYPAICDTATVTVSVGVIDAVNDSAGPVNGLPGALNVLNVFGNDTLDGSLVVPANLTLTETIAEPNGYLTLNLDGSVDVNSGTPAGVYQLTYQICETAFPSLCDTAIATVTVVAPPIVATDDSAGPVNGLTGAANVLNVLTNDTLNGLPADLTNVSLNETIAEPNGYLTLNPDGSVDVNLGTPAGIYQLTYQICEILNPTNCDNAVAVVTVGVPGLSVNKVVTSAGPYSLGATITYTLTATNTGSLPLTNVTIADNNATLGVCTPVQPAALAPNATLVCPAVYVVLQADIDFGSFVNTATANSTETPPVTDTETINFPQTSAIDLIKTGALDITAASPVEARKRGGCSQLHPHCHQHRHRHPERGDHQRPAHRRTDLRSDTTAGDPGSRRCASLHRFTHPHPDRRERWNL